VADRPRIVPVEVIESVDGYAHDELDDAQKYENSAPLDESGIYSLHILAARIYAMGFEAGERAASRRQDGERARARLRAESGPENGVSS
jgi:hypothetical protein